MKTLTSCIPDGSCTLSKRPKAFPTGVWGQAVSGDGPYVTLRDGRRYLDWMCALGALTVGHNHPKVVGTVISQLRQGAIFSLPSELEELVADRLCDIIPCAEQVKFVKTGSEATSAAVRIARAATGRAMVLALKGHYHGWHDWWAWTAEKHPGVPDIFGGFVNPCASLQSLLDVVPHSFAGKLTHAAVIVEPERVEMEVRGGLQALREVTEQHGVVLIFDEMLSGGRLALGGAQDAYKVTPDLATFGKAFGGGLPLAFVCGSPELMQHAWPVSGTFSGDALALAACDAMLDLYQEQDIIGALHRNGWPALDVVTEIGRCNPALGLKIHGTAPRFWFTFEGKDVDNRLAKSIWCQQLAKRGVLVHPNVVFASAALGPADLTQSVEAMGEALTTIAKAVRLGNLPSLLVGDVYEDSVR